MIGQNLTYIGQKNVGISGILMVELVREKKKSAILNYNDQEQLTAFSRIDFRLAARFFDDLKIFRLCRLKFTPFYRACQM